MAGNLFDGLLGGIGEDNSLLFLILLFFLFSGSGSNILGDFLGGVGGGPRQSGHR
ncbi:MAG: hypothetical protein N4A68_11990 [Maledivibacter sp.]|jgi:hypothetical protein|nr:hypothetical protein [Maledivibacter sp.]